MSSEFSSIPAIEEDVMFRLKSGFENDTHPQKVSLAPGTYRDEYGNPWILPSYRMAAEKLITNKAYHHEYLPLSGNEQFLAAARRLIFGDDVAHSTYASLQTVGGNGAVHMGSLFLYQFSDRPRVVYISDPTWENHHAIFRHAGWETATYRYYNSASNALDLEGLLHSIQNAPERSIFVLHPVGHNPTGIDPTESQWAEIADAFKSRHHFAFFDCAYQGFVSGDFARDRRAIELFADAAIPMAVCQSLSKNAGLYGERLGALHVACGDEMAARNVQQRLTWLNRREISSPPRFGADLVALVCNDPGLFEQWQKDIKVMASRVSAMRKGLYDSLTAQNCEGEWSHVLVQRGMFAYSGLTAAQTERLTSEYHIYVPPTGRLSISGLNPGNLEYVARAFAEVCKRA